MIEGEFSDCEDEYAMLGIKSYVEEEEERLSVKERLQTSRRHAETVAKTILSHLDTTFAKANRSAPVYVCLNKSENANICITPTPKFMMQKRLCLSFHSVHTTLY